MKIKVIISVFVSSKLVAESVDMPHWGEEQVREMLAELNNWRKESMEIVARAARMTKNTKEVIKLRIIKSEQ